MARGDVPGSSRRCNECRQRRKKCDLTSPQCLRCRRAGVRCSGPSASTIFIHRNQMPSDTDQRSLLRQAYENRAVDTSNALYHVTAHHLAYIRTLIAQNRFASKLPRQDELFGGIAIDTCFDSLVAEFSIGGNIFGADRVSPHLAHYSTAAIVIRTLLRTAPVHTSVVRDSVMGLLASYYGHLHCDSGLISVSQGRYIQALQQYHLVIQNINPAAHAGHYIWKVCLCVSMAMLLVEQLNHNDLFGGEAIKHAQGALALLHTAGPAMILLPDIGALLSGLRGTVLHLDLQSRRPSMLAREPWLLSHLKQSPRESLQDLGFRLATMMHDHDTLRDEQDAVHRDHSSDPPLRQLQLLQQLQQDLDHWLINLRASTKHDLYWTGEERTEDHSTDNICLPVFGDASHQLSFLSGTIAGLLVHFWAVSLETLMTMIELENTIARKVTSSDVKASTTADIQAHSIKADQVANLILETVPYLSSCYEGSLCLQGPIKTVSRYFDTWKPAMVTSRTLTA